MNQTMSLKDVSRLLNVKPYRLEYLLANRIVCEPAERIGRQTSIYARGSCASWRTHFEIKLPDSRGCGGARQTVGA